MLMLLAFGPHWNSSKWKLLEDKASLSCTSDVRSQIHHFVMICPTIQWCKVKNLVLTLFVPAWGYGLGIWPLEGAGFSENSAD